MKNIIFSSKLVKDCYLVEGSFTDNNWIKLFKKKNINLINSYGLNLIEKNLSILRPKGVILSGGNDLYKFKNSKINYNRDIIESKLLNFAIKKKIPVLGVCRGFQLIATKYNGKFKIKNNHIRKNHNLIINTKIFSQYIKNLKVNSFHKVCITEIGNYFDILARHKDDTIELVLSKNKKIMCMMFHPERKNGTQYKVNKLIYDFFKI